jgi:type IV pilus assembly protein PilC
MPIYEYSAADNTGKLSTGEKEVENERVLAETLKKEGLVLLNAKEKGKTAPKSLMQLDISKYLSFLGRITLLDKMFFARNLAVMVSAGLSLTKAMEALAEESPNPKFKEVIRDISNSVTKGKSFADSLRVHREIFGDLFINMVEVGETTGKLTLVLKLTANQMKKDHDLRGRVKGAMMYPTIIILALLLVGSLMMIYVVPTLTQTIKALGVALPPTTQLIIFISDTLANYGIFVLIAVLLLGAGAWRSLRITKVREGVDKLVIRLPVFGVLIKKLNVARFCRTLAYMVMSGVSITRSLEITSGVLGNSVYKKAVFASSAEVQKGKPLNEIFKAHPKIFQPIVTQMIQVGEETGKLADLLLRLAIFFEEDVNNTTKNLSTIIEPILMVIIGGVVAFFAISMLQPIYSSLGNV